MENKEIELKIMDTDAYRIERSKIWFNGSWNYEGVSFKKAQDARRYIIRKILRGQK